MSDAFPRETLRPRVPRHRRGEVFAWLRKGRYRATSRGLPSVIGWPRLPGLLPVLIWLAPKPPKPMRRDQRVMADALAAMGFPCYRWVIGEGPVVIHTSGPRPRPESPGRGDYRGVGDSMLSPGTAAPVGS